MAPQGGQQKGSNSILEGLSQVMANLASLSVLPDAQPHVPFVNSLMAEIQKYLHKPQVAGAALGGAPGQGGPPGAPPGAEGPPGAMGGAPQGPPPQGMQSMSPPTPPADELRRLLATAGRSA